MKNTNNNKLVFNKIDVTELNDFQLTNVNGGTLISLISPVTISIYTYLK